MVTPKEQTGAAAPETTTEKTPVGGATPVNNAFDANNGGTRIASPKVAVHVKPMGSNPGNNNNARRSSAQMNNNTQNGNGGNFGFGGHPNNQNGGNQNPNNQYRVNNDLILNFDLLDAAIGQKSQFGTTKLGSFLNNLASNPAINAKVDVDWDSETASYLITIGKAHVMWVTGLANPNSPSYVLPNRIVNPYSFGMTGSRITQFAAQQFNIQDPNKKDEGYLVIYDDDLEYNFPQVAYLITKVAFPDTTPHVTEDQFLNSRNGFNVTDTEELEKAYGNPQYARDVAAQIKEFFAANNASAMKVPGDKFAAISVTNTSAQWNAFNQNGFGFGGQFGGGFGMAFGSNGGFGVNQYQQPRTRYIAGVRYFITNESNPMVPNAKFPIAHITEIVEIGNVIVDNWIKYVLMKLKAMGYGIQLDLDISKITPNMRENLFKYFAPANQYGYGMGTNYHALTAYVNRNANSVGGKLVRISPSFLTLSVFKAMYPEYEKDSKFPKDLTDPKSQGLFEEYKRAAGFVQVLNAGTIRLVFIDNASMSIFNDYQAHQYASSQNMTYDEMMKQQQNQNGNPQQNQQPNMNYGNGWNQNGFGGNQFGGFGGGFNNQFGGRPQWGGNQFGGGFGRPQFGGYAQPGMGYPMGGNPFGNPMMGFGGQPYMVQQGVAPNQKGGKGQQPVNPYLQQTPMGYPMGPGMGMPGMTPYPMMGGNQFGGAPQYNPGMVAGGAFPSGANQPGGYIPN